MTNFLELSDLFRRKISHVDDYLANISLVEEIFERREDLELITATTGAHCLELARAHLPAAIVMETKLRDMSGIALLKLLRSADDTALIPVIALSADALSVTIEAAMDAGFFRYLTKPFKIADLTQAIDDALQFATQCQAPPKHPQLPVHDRCPGC